MGQCPSGFAPHVPGACVRRCPNDKQFFLLTGNNQPRCTYKPDPTKFVNLTPVGILPGGSVNTPPMTLDESKTADPEYYSSIVNETKRVDAEIAVHLAAIDKETQLTASFKALQDAENVRDQAPAAYQAARMAYYTLAKGPEWVEGEKKRVAAAEVDPEIEKYRRSLRDAMERKNNQQRTQDVMQSVKDGVLSMKDDVQYTAKTFQEQIGKLKNQINIERRGREKPSDEDDPFYKWIDAILNILIIGGLIAAGFVIWRKMSPSTGLVPVAYAPAAVA